MIDGAKIAFRNQQTNKCGACGGGGGDWKKKLLLRSQDKTLFWPHAQRWMLSFKVRCSCRQNQTTLPQVWVLSEARVVMDRASTAGILVPEDLRQRVIFTFFMLIQRTTDFPAQRLDDCNARPTEHVYFSIAFAILLEHWFTQGLGHRWPVP